MEQVPSPAQVNCQWCTKPMNSDATRCSSCGKLRKDIYSEKIRSYIFCLLGGLLIGFSFGFMKGNKRELDYYDNSGSSSGNTIGYVMLVAGIIAALIGIYYYIRVSQKLKSWWWA